jgi:FixJ family two-component response regulator
LTSIVFEVRPLALRPTRPRDVLAKSCGMITVPIARVAIVDDEASVRKALARLLGASAFNSQTYASAREFLDSLASGVPECLIVDLQMPEMTGLELQGELLRAGIKIPTIIITAHDEKGFFEQCRAAGAIAYLLKPMDEATLIAAVNKAIGR